MPYCTLSDSNKLYFEIYSPELDLSKPETHIKPTVIVLHGGPNADHIFHVPFFQQLAADAQVIFYDHRGCGRSDGDDPTQWNMQQWAQDLHEFCQKLHIEKPYIAGVSFGGWVAMQYAALYPTAAIAGLILLDTEAFFDLESKMDDYEQAANNTDIREVVYNFYKHPTPANNERFAEQCVPLFTQCSFPAELFQHCLVRDEIDAHFKLNVAPTYNLLDKLSSTKTRVLYISGTTNPHHSAKDAKKSAAAFSSAEVKLCLLESSGFSTVDNPEETAAIVRQFITTS